MSTHRLVRRTTGATLGGRGRAHNTDGGYPQAASKSVERLCTGPRSGAQGSALLWRAPVEDGVARCGPGGGEIATHCPLERWTAHRRGGAPRVSGEIATATPAQTVDSSPPPQAPHQPAVR